MKKYFLFDNEPISGEKYFLRLIISCIFFIVLIGIWLAASTAYKRSGAFGWKKPLKVVCAILIPIYILFSAMSYEYFYSFNFLNLELFVALLTVLHLVLLFKNGNKNS